MRARYLEAARVELRGAVRYYNTQRPGLGAEFKSEVRAAIQRIKRLPRAWQAIDGEDLRRCQTNRFPYGVIYQIRDKEILIIAVAHLHREPGYWLDRLDP